MTQLPPSRPVGSYDDLPDEGVQTVLSVPIAWTGPGTTSHGRSRPDATKGRGRHARSRPAPTAAPSPARRNAHHTGARFDALATLRIGLISAAVVLGLATLGLMAVTLLP